MKRSEINELMRSASELIRDNRFLLPGFAYWSPAEWKTKGLESIDIIRQQLGWDITDFGSGDFGKVGLILFTIRNGVFREAATDSLAKSYGEKIMVVEEEQITPIHFHYKKTEDIINRGGGTLVLQLWNATVSEELADTEVEVSIDGVRYRMSAGSTIELAPGQSVCLVHGLYHQFWGKKHGGPILVGEISRVCDEYTDNRFLEPVGRFATISEDVAPCYLLFDDYKRYYQFYEKASE